MNQDMEQSIQKAYRLWLDNAVEDPDLQEELRRIDGQEEEIFDRFYRELEFPGPRRLSEGKISPILRGDQLRFPYQIGFIRP